MTFLDRLMIAKVGKKKMLTGTGFEPARFSSVGSIVTWRKGISPAKHSLNLPPY